VLREPGVVERIRTTRDAAALYAIVTEMPRAA
jgi:PTS system nitrogen regulatory IIA component